MLNEDQAKAVADALLFSNENEQRARAGQREAQARQSDQKRRAAAFVLAGILVGGSMAYFLNLKISVGIVTGALLGRLVNMCLQAGGSRWRT